MTDAPPTSRQASVNTTPIATSLADIDTTWAIVGQKLPVGRHMLWSYSLDMAPLRMALAAGAILTAQRYDGQIPVLLAKRSASA